jgi:PIN domain nuclease of toxin-antitoxin system
MRSARLGAEAGKLIGRADVQLYMSAASWWELGIKCALGKLDADLRVVRRSLQEREVQLLSVTVEHGEAAAALPILHRDPFDHMLVAQATVEGMTLLTRDARLKSYGHSVLCV